jgi:GNAT superfamily N-acetyltransferase
VRWRKIDAGNSLANEDVDVLQRVDSSRSQKRIVFQLMQRCPARSTALRRHVTPLPPAPSTLAPAITIAQVGTMTTQPPDPPMVVRLARPGDIADIAALIEDIERFYGSTAIQPLDERVAQTERALFGTPPLATALLAEADNALMGLAAYSYLWPAAGSTHSLYLKELYVRPDRRGRGTGTRLMTELRAIAAARPGCSRIEWTADQDNPAVRAFYHSLGVEEFTGKIMYRLSQ